MSQYLCLGCRRSDGNLVRCSWCGGLKDGTIPKPLNPRQAYRRRAQLALQLQHEHLTFADIALVLRLRSKNDARRHVARAGRDM